MAKVEKVRGTFLVIPSDYSELRLICWHRNPDAAISEEDAFGLYEANWRYVSQERLTAAEGALIERLKNRYGNGVING
ncbi:hypothetical protein [Marinobacter sp. ELB17]|uniref:hypothetical protein n=1 Tax=Marinobacter sp. ELB17 TaxID=270374 RepID=UPI0000F388C3|nr:hypothetical protein [Marinobacter sp. ELB17]EAZ97291.1 hypothetical protein MELB17_09533 [Marinobacter sp. ELB17]EAZ97327.1 hypothetical protein MELB17_09323 [Marinobacter sp. ELB17]